MNCLLFGSHFWLCKVFNASMPSQFPYHELHINLCRSRWKRGIKISLWGIKHIEQFESIIWGTIFSFQDLLKNFRMKG
jgi:hypothetical protein